MKFPVAAVFLLGIAACQPGKAEPPPVDPGRPPTSSQPAMGNPDASVTTSDGATADAKPEDTRPSGGPDAGPVTRNDASVGAPDVNLPDVTRTDVASADPTGSCRYQRGPADGKIAKTLLDAYAGGAASRNVAVVYNSEPNDTLPMCPPPDRNCPARQAEVEARRKRADEVKRCVSARITMLGSQPLEVPVLMLPVTLARLTLAQAQDIAGLTDVRSLEDAQQLSLP